MTEDFTARVVASLPAGITLPPAIAGALDWLAGRGQVVQTPDGPVAELHGSVSFLPVDPDHMRYWLGNADAGARVAPFVRTGGDGSTAGLWLDDSGTQHFVHLGSGSGSAWAGVITDDPVDFLRFLAIGHDEPCWPDDHAAVPEDVPVAFREYVTATHGVPIPARAADLITSTPDMDDDDPVDPFLRWVDANRG